MLSCPIPHFNSFAKFLGIDFIIHNKKAYKIADDSIVDFLWSSSTNMLGLWMVQDPESRLFVRQAAASAFHFGRLIVTSGHSCGDVFFSKLVHAFFPNNPYFTDKASIKRFYRRVMLALRANGGIYSELSDVLRTIIISCDFNRDIHPFSKISSQYPAVSRSSSKFPFHYSYPAYTIEEVKELFEKSTGKPFDSVFQSVSPSSFDDSLVIVHDAILKSGVPVSLSILPPHRLRMRTLDSIPLVLFSKCASILPFLPAERAVLSTIVNRISYDLLIESNARTSILKAMGIDTSLDPSTLFRKSRRSASHIFIPAPISDLCTHNIMVSDQVPKQPSKIVASDAKRLFTGFSDLYFKYGKLVTNFTPKNFRKEGGRVSLGRFSPVSDADPVLLHSCYNLYSSMKKGDRKVAYELGSLFGLRNESIDKSMELRFPTKSMIKEIVAHNSDLVIGTAEALSGLECFRKESGSGYLVYTPIVLGMAAKTCSASSDHTSHIFNLFSWLKELPF